MYGRDPTGLTSSCCSLEGEDRGRCCLFMRKRNLQNHSARSIDKLSHCSFLFQYFPPSRRAIRLFTITNSTTVKKTVNKKLTIDDWSFDKSFSCMCVITMAFSEGRAESRKFVESSLSRAGNKKNFLPDSFKFYSHLSRG